VIAENTGTERGMENIQKRKNSIADLLAVL
jgi:hypothetical protein